MRPSALAMSANCPASFSLNKGYGSEVAVEGTAFHILAKNKVLNEPIDFDYVEKRFNLDEQQMKDLRIGLYNLEVAIPEGVIVHTEELIKSTTMNLQGTFDLFLEKKTEGTLLDWKNGRMDVHHPKNNLQLISYGIMVFENYPHIERLNLVVLQTRLRQYKEYMLTREEAIKYRDIIEEIIIESEKEKPQFITGSWCSDCFNCLACPAFAGQYLEFSKSIVPVAGSIDVKQALEQLVPMAKRATTIATGILNLAKAYIDQHGSINLGGGTIYAKVEYEKKKLDIKKTLQVLEGFFHGAEMEIITVSASKITELARKNKEKRGLAKQVTAKLEEVGAFYKEPAVIYKILKNCIVEQKDETI